MNRRIFIKSASSTAATIALTPDILIPSQEKNHKMKIIPGEAPWYKRVTRWGQTNITERDPPNYDISRWRKQWKDTETGGVIINAGGIVAYYPSSIPLHRQAEYLGGRDLFGDLCNAAHSDGLAVFARMDSNRAHEEFYRAYPDWFAINLNGDPYKAGEMYITCVNSPYYNEHIPAILTEIAKLYGPEGFTDNSWSGLGRGSICYCNNCRKSFFDSTGYKIPEKADWDDQVYRHWIMWNYKRRLEIWDLNNRTTRQAGGPECIWSGMNSGSISWQAESFRDYKAVCERADIIMLDSQARSDSGGFQQNSCMGKLIHGILAWDKLIPESMAMYQAGRPTFRMASKPVNEARMWMLEGIAGGIQPWWHYVGASHEDKRMYKTPGQVMKWHKLNEKYLTGRKPLATVGVIWSQLNTDFYGRDDADMLVDQPWRGLTQALIRARIPFIPINADNIDRDSAGLSLLVLPELGVMTASQIEAVRNFNWKGGGILATGRTSLFDEWGDIRQDYGLADVFGTHLEKPPLHGSGAELRQSVSSTLHTYLRLLPELYGKDKSQEGRPETEGKGKRHPVLTGFDGTDILSFGGLLQPAVTDEGTEVLMTFIPQFPIYPPETAWMRVPRTEIPGLVTKAGKGRVAFMPADLDRQFGRYNLPDHGNLLSNLVKWCAGENIPLRVDCPGLIDCNIYTKNDFLVLHLVNLTSTATWRQPIDEYIPIGPVKTSLKIPESFNSKKVRSIVSGKEIPFSCKNGWCDFVLDSITDHDVIVIS
jgi:hypothetical protein